MQSNERTMTSRTVGDFAGEIRTNALARIASWVACRTGLSGRLGFGDDGSNECHLWIVSACWVDNYHGAAVGPVGDLEQDPLREDVGTRVLGAREANKPETSVCREERRAHGRRRATEVPVMAVRPVERSAGAKVEFSRRAPSRPVCPKVPSCPGRGFEHIRRDEFTQDQRCAGQRSISERRIRQRNPYFSHVRAGQVAQHHRETDGRRGR